MAKIPTAERPRAFVDTETTGLDPLEQEVIEVAYMVEAPDGTILRAFETKFKPQRLETAHPKALEINGYSAHPEEWEKAPLFDEQHAQLIYDDLKDCIIVGQNPKFDVDFLREGMKRAGLETRFGYHVVDTVTLAYEQLIPCGLKWLSMDAIRKFLGWSGLRAHTAMKDVRDVHRLYHALARATWLDRLWWTLQNRVRRWRKK